MRKAMITTFSAVTLAATLGVFVTPSQGNHVEQVSVVTASDAVQTISVSGGRL